MLKIMISTKLTKEKNNTYYQNNNNENDKKKKKKIKQIRIITKVKNDSGITIKEELNHNIYIYLYIGISMLTN